MDTIEDCLTEINLNEKSNLPFLQNRNSSTGKFSDEINNPEGRVLVLYTGGTIGMVRNETGGNVYF